jgi:cytosine/uracil/thiamine/allantoin permease
VSTLLLAASEPSKVPFFIAGGALAAWAVILATVGLNRPDFPRNLRGQRTVIGITFTLMVIAIAMAIVTS